LLDRLQHHFEAIGEIRHVMIMVSRFAVIRIEDRG
jgi:hypothetical protein